MTNIIKGKKILSYDDDCKCGKAVKISERKKLGIKRTIKKRL